MSIYVTQKNVGSEASVAVRIGEQHGEHPALTEARHRAVPEGLGYAGAIDPVSAFELCKAGTAVLVDVRTAEERKFGVAPGSVHIAWQTGTAMIRNPRFLKELSAKISRDTIVLFICRSGRRSADAAAAASKDGYLNAFNVLEGFEGADKQPGSVSGWRHHGLPWIQP